MTTRFFSFGCSLTNYFWFTWADIVGANFDKFYNLGRGGVSNFYIFCRLMEIDERYNFNPDTDTVAIMTTGINRFSFMTDDVHWKTSGDVGDHDYTITGWSDDWAIYQSWISILSMKKFLEAKNIKHFFLKGLDFSHYIENKSNLFKVGKESLSRLRQIDAILDVKSPLFSDNKVKHRDQLNDGHPRPSNHLDYVEKELPIFFTDKSMKRYNFLYEGFDTLPYEEYVELLKRKISK